MYRTAMSPDVATRGGRAGGEPPLLLAPLLRLAHSLRGAGVPVSTSELLDATAALSVVDLADRAAVKGAAAATLIKRSEDLATFDALFELHFAMRAGRRRDATVEDEAPLAGVGGDRPRIIETSLDRAAGAGAGEDDDPSTALLEALIEALRRGDLDALRALAELSVERFGGLATGTATSERYLVHRVMRALELSQLMARALAADRAEARGGIDERRARADLLERIDAFRAMLAEQVRVHLAELLGADEGARSMGHVVTEETDFLGASPRQLAAMRETIRPLARALATRMGRRRRRRDRGRLDVRRTVRRSLSTGGVPIDPVFRHPRVARPDLYVLCDVSGSVAEFASFTLTLLQAMTSEFPRMRTFAFVDGVDEVTMHLKDVASFLEVRHVLFRANVVRGDGHSDYGAVLEQFWDRQAASIDSRSTVIITGDARSNRRPPGAAALKALHARARRVYLLNPEPAAEWNTTDSIVDVYRPYLHEVFEVRNLRQLADAVLRIG
jgi:uncharacterized protein with von Willebrand factor type A (vWA) domain